MSKYNCDYIADYIHELNRLCKTMSDCSKCIMNKSGCDLKADTDTETLAGDIIRLQEWSDNSPDNEA